MERRSSPAPLVAPVLLWCLGIILARTLRIPDWGYPLLAVLFLAAGILLSRLRLWLLLVLCVVLGGWRFQSTQKSSMLDAILRQQGQIQQEAEFEVLRLYSSQSRLHEIRLTRLANQELDEPLLLFAEPELEPGRHYTALLQIVPGNPDPVLDRYPLRNQAFLKQNLKALPPGRSSFLSRWRAALLRNLDRKLGDDAAYAKALLLSDTAAKTLYRQRLQRGGMTHLIVVSGLHVWFIYGISLILLNLLLPRRWAEMLFIVLICFYAALNLWSAPVVRAVLMIATFILARWLSRKVAREQILALSLLIVTLINPGQLFEVGLQLSYLSVGVILLAVPRLSLFGGSGQPAGFWKGQLNIVLHYVLVSAVVSLAILPLTLYYFGSASLNGVLGNILAIPLTAVLLSLSFLVLFVPAGNMASVALVSSYRFVLYLFEGWTTWIARLPFYLENWQINLWQMWGILMLLWGIYLLFKSRRRMWIPAVAVGLILILLPMLLLKPAGGIYVFKAGTADCILVRFPDGTTLMVDTGALYSESTESWAGRKLLPWLRRKGLHSLDYVILTHNDTDHSGGFPDLARNLKLKNILATDETMNSSEWKTWQEQGLLKGSRLHCVTDTLSLVLGGARLKILHPDAGFSHATDNNASIVFRLDFRQFSYLFTGDIEREAEQYLLQHYPEELKADYLKAAHHGSRSSNTAEFVRAVQPREVWITASETNRFGFPHPEVLATFKHYAQSIRSSGKGTIFVPFE